MNRWILPVMLALVGCGGSSSSPPQPVMLLGKTPLDSAPTNGLQIILPVVAAVPPSSSQEWCTWTEHVLPQDIDIKSTKAFQTPTGHHVVLFYTTTQQPPGTTRLCTNDDMASFRFAGAGGEGAGASVLPGDLVVHIPKGAQLVANHHYLNAGSKAVDAQSAINVTFADPGAKTERASAVAMLDTSMRAHPGHSSFDVTCTMNADLAFWMLEPHMHEYGSHVLVERVGGDTLFDIDWDPAYIFHPPQVLRDPSAPFLFHTGDQVHVRCTWDNPTNTDLTFGIEMCVLFGQTIDPTELGNLECNGGQWGPF